MCYFYSRSSPLDACARDDESSANYDLEMDPREDPLRLDECEGASGVGEQPEVKSEHDFEVSSHLEGFPKVACEESPRKAHKKGATFPAAMQYRLVSILKRKEDSLQVPSHRECRESSLRPPPIEDVRAGSSKRDMEVEASATQPQNTLHFATSPTESILEPEDDTDVFFRSMAMTAKEFHPLILADLKKKICAVVMDSQIENEKLRASMHTRNLAASSHRSTSQISRHTQDELQYTPFVTVKVEQDLDIEDSS